MNAETLTSPRELHARTADGVVVRLLWSQDEDRVFVDVNDEKTGQAFSLDIPDGVRPLDVFTHPFAYRP